METNHAESMLGSKMEKPIAMLEASDWLRCVVIGS
jgi:hypothetical protein